MNSDKLQTRIIQAKTLHFLVERRPIDIQSVGRRRTIPMMKSQRLQDNLTLRPLEGLAECFSINLIRKRLHGERIGHAAP